MANDLSSILNQFSNQMTAMTAAMSHMSGSVSGAGTNAVPMQSAQEYVSGFMGGGGMDSDARKAVEDFLGTGKDSKSGFFRRFAGTLMAPVAMAPSSTEAYNLEMLASRMGFYSNAYGPIGHESTGLYKTGNTPRPYVTPYATARGVAEMGTATSAMDPAAALNYGAGVGLLPGLDRYGVGKGFSGILGGAALASNLTPGLGITGGVGAMASLNQARTVNAMRMLGIEVRGAGGATMNDLPAIIKQIYDMLSNAAGGVVTPESIAVSNMSGNALDSLLSQFFGNDTVLRGTVISGLIQMSRNKGLSLATSGTKAELQKTGGTTETAMSLATRNLRELGMMQNYTRYATAGTRDANTMLGQTYSYMNGMVNRGGGLAERALTGLNVFNAARNNTGTVVTDALMGGGGLAAAGLKAAFMKMGPFGKILAGAGAAGLLLDSTLTGSEQAPGDLRNTNIQNYTPTAAPTYTGPITINVTAPPNADPYAVGIQVRNGLAGGS